MPEARMRNSGDHAIFDNVAPGVFDNSNRFRIAWRHA
jgi:hypothetical protein